MKKRGYSDFRRRHFFTLLEIVICVAILGFAAVGVGWQMKDMVAQHHFSKNIDSLFTDLKRCQLIAACDRADIEVVIEKVGSHYTYVVRADDPLPSFLSKKIKLSRVQSLYENKKRVSKSTIHFYPSGRFDPVELKLSQNSKNYFTFNLKTPSIIELKQNNQYHKK